MDATAKRRKSEELATWQRNLATLQAQAANHGMSPPIELINEIETAQRNIKRVQQELDAGHEESAEQTAISLFELVLVLSRRLDDAYALIKELLKRLDSLERKVSRAAVPPSRAAWASRWTAYAIIAAIYTAFLVPEIRNVILSNALVSAGFIVMAVTLAVLFRLLSAFMQPGGNDD